MTDYFRDLLPYAIEYGMSVKEFWEEDPDLFWAYRFSYVNKKKQEQEIFNIQAWLQGAYFYEAVAVALSNAFSKKKIEYRSKPFDFKEENKDTKKPKQNLLEERLKSRAMKVQQMLRGEKK